MSVGHYFKADFGTDGLLLNYRSHLESPVKVCGTSANNCVIIIMMIGKLSHMMLVRPKLKMIHVHVYMICVGNEPT